MATKKKTKRAAAATTKSAKKSVKRVKTAVKTAVATRRKPLKGKPAAAKAPTRVKVKRRRKAPPRGGIVVPAIGGLIFAASAVKNVVQTGAEMIGDALSRSSAARGNGSETSPSPSSESADKSPADKPNPGTSQS